MPDPQDRPVSLCRGDNGRGTCLLIGAYDRRHVMTPMSRAGFTGDPSLNPPFSVPGSAGSVAADGFLPTVVSSTAAFPSARQTRCHTIPIAHGPAQFKRILSIVPAHNPFF